MVKHYILVWNNGEPQRIILHALGCDIPETFTNEGQEGITEFYRMFAENFKESNRVHACPAVATPYQREEWTHQTHGAVVKDTEDINLDDEDSLMPTLMYLEEYDDKEDNPLESLSDPTSVEPTPEPGPPSEKPTKEPTSEPDFDALSEPSAPTREGSIGNLSTGDIVR